MHCWIGLVLMFVTANSAVGPDWKDAEVESEILVTTSNPDGSERLTTIWIAVLDGTAFVRTSGTRWERNVERNPDVVLTVAGKTRAVRLERVHDDDLVDRVQAQFRKKYGSVADRMARFVRFVLGGESRIYRATWVPFLGSSRPAV